MIQGIVGVGSDPSMRYYVSPTGGIIAISPQSDADFSTWTITRYFSVSGVAVSGVTLVQGVEGASPTELIVDIGDGTNAPLDVTQLYIYEFATANGSVQTPALSPACSIVLEVDHLGAILRRALQSGIASLALPTGFKAKPPIIHAMPLNGMGTPTIPSISFNETLFHPEDFKIGEDVDTDDVVNQWQIANQALRHYTIFVVSNSPKEREYYKEAVISIFCSVLPILNLVGANIRHRFIASSSQIVGRSNEPGFYFSEILLEIVGLYSVGVTTSYGVIENFSITATEDEVNTELL